jgi:hypothetical protein
MEYYKNLSLESLFYINDEGLVCLEEWRDIPNYEGIYQVSSLGRIKSFHKKGRIMKQSLVDRYLYVILCKNKTKKNYFSQQLVAMAFLGHTPFGFKIVVDHIDDNELNNYHKNLQLLTNRQNIEKGFKRKNLTSKYTGVYFNKSEKKFRANIKIKHKKNCHLGYFKEELDAHNAYQTALNNLDKYESNKQFKELCSNYNVPTKKQ